MKFSFDYKRLLWLIIPILFTVWAAQLEASDLRTIALILLWYTGIAYSIPLLAKPILWLRRFPAILWLIWLISISGAIIVWIVRFQPAIALPLSPVEQFWLLSCAIGLILLPIANLSIEERAGLGKRLGWQGSPLISVTTIVLIVIAIELGLRYFWVASDNFQFSKMHQNWARLYWNPINEKGYRDYPVPAADDKRTHIIVAGDSLAAGYGVDHIADTFPHKLNDLLGDDYTVSIVAQPGWGVASELGAVIDYPIKPDILILSHYINDINEGTAGKNYGRPFPPIRLDPDETQRWWVDNFYIANFLYYRVFLYTQHDAVHLYDDWVYGAYSNHKVWRAYKKELQTVIDWTNENNVRLIVLVWPDLLNVEGSRSITNPVVKYFSNRDIPVLDMANYFQDEPPSRLTVNPFDAHPSIYSHKIVAEQLAKIIQNEQNAN